MALFGSLFGQKKLQTSLGVDIGAGGVKIVELASERGRGRLVRYVFADRPLPESPTLFLDRPQETGALIKKLLADAKITTRTAIAGIPPSMVFSSVLSVNVSSKKKALLDEAIRQQARKVLPKPLEEMQIDASHIIAENPKETRVLMAAAETVVVKKYAEIFAAAGLTMQSLETESLALVRSLLGKDMSTVLLVDMGTMRTSLSLIERGIPVLSRSIDLGGMYLTRSLAESVAVTMTEAEQIKRDIRYAVSNPSDTTTPRILEPFLQQVVNEARFILQGRSSAGVATPVEKVILTGGAAMLPRAAEAFAASVGIRTIIGDPWARVVYPADMQPVLENLGPRFGVAVGLAMRDII